MSASNHRVHRARRTRATTARPVRPAPSRQLQFWLRWTAAREGNATFRRTKPSVDTNREANIEILLLAATAAHANKSAAARTDAQFPDDRLRIDRHRPLGRTSSA